jgi:hypothetical protein
MNAEIRAFKARDWQRLERAKSDLWAERKEVMTPSAFARNGEWVVSVHPGVKTRLAEPSGTGSGLGESLSPRWYAPCHKRPRSGTEVVQRLVSFRGSSRNSVGTAAPDCRCGYHYPSALTVLGERAAKLDISYIRSTLEILEQALGPSDLLPFLESELARVGDRGRSPEGPLRK